MYICALKLKEKPTVQFNDISEIMWYCFVTSHGAHNGSLLLTLLNGRLTIKPCVFYYID